MEENLLLGYFFTILNYMFYCISRFGRRKQQMLLDLLSKISFVIGMVFMGSLSGAYSMVVNFIYLILATIKERKHYKWPGLYVILELLLVCAMVNSFAGISSILIFISTSISLLAVWWLPPQKMRLTGLVANIFTLFYHFSLRNWAGLCEIAVITSNITSYVRYQQKSRQSA